MTDPPTVYIDVWQKVGAEWHNVRRAIPPSRLIDTFTADFGPFILNQIKEMTKEAVGNDFPK